MSPRHDSAEPEYLKKLRGQLPAEQPIRDLDGAKLADQASIENSERLKAQLERIKDEAAHLPALESLRDALGSLEHEAIELHKRLYSYLYPAQAGEQLQIRPPLRDLVDELMSRSIALRDAAQGLIDVRDAASDNASIIVLDDEINVLRDALDEDGG